MSGNNNGDIISVDVTAQRVTAPTPAPAPSASRSTFTRKLLDVEFQLGQGDFGLAGINSIKVSGLRASAVIEETGGPSFAHLDLSVDGMTLSHMQAISTLGQTVTTLKRNSVILSAGDAVNGMAVVYQGQITSAWADFSGQPDVAFRVEGHAGALEAATPIAPSSYAGLADVSTIMSGLATQANLSFVNYGVTAKLIDPYFPGTIWEQMRRCAQAANINFIQTLQSLIIWPKGGARGTEIPLVSADTGMIGYPSFVANGIRVSTVYNPSIGFGQQVQVQSTLTPANGKWQIQALVHHLESGVPNGQWMSTFVGVPPGLFVISK